MQMKPLTLFLTIVFQLVSFTAFSQQNAGLNSLLDKNAEFIFPQTPDKISKALNVKTIFYEDANDEKYAKWITKSGVLLYASLGNNKTINEMSFDMEDDKGIVVEGLPYQLALNKTTLQQSTAKFSKYGATKEKLGEYTELPGGSKLTFKKGKHYTILMFDRKNLLKSVYLTTELIGPGVN